LTEQISLLSLGKTAHCVQVKVHELFSDYERLLPLKVNYQTFLDFTIMNDLLIFQ